MVVHFVGALLGNSSEHKPLEAFQKSLNCDFEGETLELFIENTLDDFSSEHNRQDSQFIWGYTHDNTMEELMLGFAQYYNMRETQRVKEYVESGYDPNRFTAAYSGKAWQPYAEPKLPVRRVCYAQKQEAVC